MKVKNIEREMEKKIKHFLNDFETILTLEEAYEKEASRKRRDKYSKKLYKKYGKQYDKIEKRVDNLDM